MSSVSPVTEGASSRALEGLEGEGGGSARLVALEGDDQGKLLWRILAYRGVVEALSAMEGLLGHLEKLKVTVLKTKKLLREVVNNA
jgi:hypothetical protein